jgi:hypothetical protein
MTLVSCGLMAGAAEAGGEKGRRTLEDRIPALQWARLGARDRLAKPECQAVLADFTDPRGRRLDDVLRESGRTAPEQLDLLEFESGLGRPACRGAVMAFTQMRSSVVSICLRQFGALNPPQREAILIHEMLHSLGLGENPPESAAITAQVLKRCGH